MLKARISYLAAVDRHGYEQRETLTTRAEEYGYEPVGVLYAEEVAAWDAWLDEMHECECRLWELRVRQGNEVVDAAVDEAGVLWAEWEDMPGCVRKAIRALGSD